MSRNNTPAAMPQRSTPNSQAITKIPKLLPHERVFPIQIGSELFKLSGASLSSDAPSYFSEYFRCQMKAAEEAGQDPCSAIRTLYIDRDPETFKDISLHLQGYHIQPRDGTHFVRLFADAQFYTLPKLRSQLYEESLFMSIGHREFQIPRDVFSDPGNSPNYFSLGSAVFFLDPSELFPGLERDGLIRPPSILPPAVPGRSAEIFADLLNLLKGNPVEIRNEQHRMNLIKDAKYYHFKGLEQKLIPHDISFNQMRGGEEIMIRLADVLKSGVNVAADSNPENGYWVTYKRPFVDKDAMELILEIGGENMRLHFPPKTNDPGSVKSDTEQVLHCRAELFRDVETRIAKLFEVLATKLNLPPTTQPLGLLMASGGASSQPATPGKTPLSDDRVKALINGDASVTLNDKPWTWSSGTHRSSQRSTDVLTGDDSNVVNGEPPDSLGALSLHGRKRRRVGDDGGDDDKSDEMQWSIRTGQWRLNIVPKPAGGVECILVAVKLDAVTSQRARNRHRGFLES